MKLSLRNDVAFGTNILDVIKGLARRSR